MENCNMTSQPIMTNLKQGHTYTNPRPGQYLTHAHSHITRAVAAMDSCFALTGSHYETTTCWSLICTSSPTVAGVEWRVGVCVGVGGGGGGEE